MNNEQRSDRSASHASDDAGASSSMSDAASSVTDETKAKVSEMAAPAKEKARAIADEQKAASADQLSSVSRALHGAADQIVKDMPQAASYVHSAAKTLEGASNALRSRSIEELLSDFNGFAKRQPAAAFAGAVLAGFALLRFMKSSSVQSRKQA